MKILNFSRGGLADEFAFAAHRPSRRMNAAAHSDARLVFFSALVFVVQSIA